ncbi:MAG: lipid-A-disaccharide synthase [Oscillatoriales cyanobacterium SM2_2_1]|nr:lipid-A-disaccharide synthase [Oscillatoriales cyanobacterium SM2_2_1]
MPSREGQEPWDLVFLVNGPGELTTWLYPVLQALTPVREPHWRVSVVLSPCPNASGNEADLVRGWGDRVLPATQFYRFLLTGRAADWTWGPRGVVVFLGGDQFFTVAIARWLGYRTVVYAEWVARWVGWVDAIAARHEFVKQAVPTRWQSKVTVIGDLMVDRARSPLQPEARVTFLPGSKPHKLGMGVPLCLAIADALRARYPDLSLDFALAPTVSPGDLPRYDPTVTVTETQATTGRGTVVALHRTFPAHDLWRRSQLCVTTIGANTAELASLGVPMIVLLPTNNMDTPVGWDGLLGQLAKVPGFNRLVNGVMVWLLTRSRRLFAWPNLWAGEEIVPELFGRLDGDGVATVIGAYLDHPERLTEMGDRLRHQSGPPGAAQRLVSLIQSALEPSVV